MHSSILYKTYWHNYQQGNSTENQNKYLQWPGLENLCYFDEHVCCRLHCVSLNSWCNIPNSHSTTYVILSNVFCNSHVTPSTVFSVSLKNVEICVELYSTTLAPDSRISRCLWLWQPVCKTCPWLCVNLSVLASLQFCTPQTHAWASLCQSALCMSPIYSTVSLLSLSLCSSAHISSSVPIISFFTKSLVIWEGQFNGNTPLHLPCNLWR